MCEYRQAFCTKDSIWTCLIPQRQIFTNSTSGRWPEAAFLMAQKENMFRTSTSFLCIIRGPSTVGRPIRGSEQPPKRVCSWTIGCMKFTLFTHSRLPLGKDAILQAIVGRTASNRSMDGRAVRLTRMTAKTISVPFTPSVCDVWFYSSQTK